MAPRSTRTLSTATAEAQASAIIEAAAILRSGGLVAFPTETVYGLGADATNPAAVARIFGAKGRPATNPLIVHASDLAMARRCVSAWPPTAATLAEAFWPGPLTLVLPRSDAIPDIVTAGLATVGLRIPASSLARRLIEAAGLPIAAPSANRSTGISPTLAAHVAKDLEGRVDLILDGGPTAVGIESTVVDVSGQAPRILRPGMISAREIGQALGEEVEVGAPATAHANPQEPMTSPGQMALHYAPRTPSYRFGAATRPSEISRRLEPMHRVGLLVLGCPGLANDTGQARWRIDLPTVNEAGRRLYAALHQLDDAGLEAIAIIGPPDGPEWAAIADRVRRATSNKTDG